MLLLLFVVLLLLLRIPYLYDSDELAHSFGQLSVWLASPLPARIPVPPDSVTATACCVRFYRSFTLPFHCLSTNIATVHLVHLDGMAMPKYIHSRTIHAHIAQCVSMHISSSIKSIIRCCAPWLAAMCVPGTHTDTHDPCVPNARLWPYSGNCVHTQGDTY